MINGEELGEKNFLDFNMILSYQYSKSWYLRKIFLSGFLLLKSKSSRIANIPHSITQDELFHRFIKSSNLGAIESILLFLYGEK